MVEKDQYERLRQRFGKYSSWAIWKNPDPDRPASNTEDMTVFDDEELLEKIHTNYIFIGLNAAMHDEINAEDWGAFHSKDTKKQRDYKLRYALKDTEYWGAYITDVIKGYNETNVSEVIKATRNDPNLLRESKELLKEELEIIGGYPVLVALGGTTYQILKNMRDDLPSIADIIKAPHFSQRISKEKYRARLLHCMKGAVNNASEGQGQDMGDSVIKLTTHWECGTFRQANVSGYKITIDKLKNRLDLWVLQDNNVPNLQLILICKKEWIEVLFDLASHISWNRDFSMEAFDVGIWRAEIEFLNGKKVKCCGRTERPDGTSDLERMVKSLLEEHDIKIPIIMFSGTQI